MKWPFLDAGELVHQITILRPVPGEDASGTTVDMVPWKTVYAKIDVLRGTDTVQSGQITSQTMVTISTWWFDGMESNMQIQTHDGRYIIRAIEKVSLRNIVLKMDCISLSGG